jgi:ribosomal protein S27E
MHIARRSTSAAARSRLEYSANQHLYRRHRPEQTALYPVIETNLTAFLEYLHERDAALPRFVTDEFKDYLRCGRLEYGFIRVKCDSCRHEHLVAFSCKRRGFCQSCGARRMIEISAHLIDHVAHPDRYATHGCRYAAVPLGSSDPRCAPNHRSCHHPCHRVGAHGLITSSPSQTYDVPCQVRI